MITKLRSKLTNLRPTRPSLRLPGPFNALTKARDALIHGPKKAAQKHSCLAWGAVEQLIRLADKAQIPLVGGAFGVAAGLIDMYNGAGDNQKAFKVLVQNIASHSETLWEFVHAMNPDYVKESNDARAKIARRAIMAFGQDVDKVRLLIMKHSQGGFIRRGIMNTTIKEEIVRMEKQLTESHRRFTDATVNAIISGVQSLTNGTLGMEPMSNDLQIFGARPLSPHDIDASTMESARGLPIDGPWSDVVQAVVAGKQRLVKLYHDSCGGEQAFLRDLQWYGKNARPELPGVYGYCRSSTIPFIVFGLPSTVSLNALADTALLIGASASAGPQAITA